MKDLVIIGSGPAGLSAGVYAKRAQLDTVIIEKEPYSGGQIVNSERVDNYLGLYGIGGYELATKFKEHAQALEVPFYSGNVLKIEDDTTHKCITFENGETLLSKSVLIATGARYRRLQVPGETEHIGMGVSFCATCDGAFFREKDVVVIGGGNVAFGDALYLANLCNKVYLVHRRDTFRATKQLQEKVRQTNNIEILPFFEVEKIDGENAVESIFLVNSQTNEKKQLLVNGVFVAIGMEPQSDFVKEMVETDSAGYIVAQENGKTNVAGIFVAGDVRTKSVRQLVTAVADGANAVASIEDYLVGIRK